MITAFLDCRLQPDHLDDGPAIIHDVLTATRAFAGNLGVEVLQDRNDATHFVVVEQWESMEADDAYRAWRATPEGASALRTIVAEPPTLTWFDSRADV